MTNELDKLSADDRKKLMRAVPLITVLIAGSDGEISDKEREWATKITHIKSFNAPDDVKLYYSELEPSFSQMVDDLIEELPLNVDKRNNIITERLKEIKPVLLKLGTFFRGELYKSFKSMAKHIAKADGGFIGAFSIDVNERNLIGLEMLDPEN